MSYVIGIDVGGTFTDLVAQDASGQITSIKIPSTPQNPQQAVVEALESLLQRLAAKPAIQAIIHSTTIATNALLGQMGLELPEVTLITTEGFSDLIEIGRQNRPEVYNLLVQRPKPLVPPARRLTVKERMSFEGEVISSIDMKDLEHLHQKLTNTKTVAICFLNSYANNAHEQFVAKFLADRYQALHISCSETICPEYREYERFSTAIVNAALSPLVKTYLTELASYFKALKINCPFYVMQSNGGMMLASHENLHPASLHKHFGRAIVPDCAANGSWNH